MSLSLAPTHLKRYAEVARLFVKYGRGPLATDLSEESAADASPGRANPRAASRKSWPGTWKASGRRSSSSASCSPAAPTCSPRRTWMRSPRLQDKVEPFSFEEAAGDRRGRARGSDHQGVFRLRSGPDRGRVPRPGAPRPAPGRPSRGRQGPAPQGPRADRRGPRGDQRAGGVPGPALVDRRPLRAREDRRRLRAVPDRGAGLPPRGPESEAPPQEPRGVLPDLGATPGRRLLEGARPHDGVRRRAEGHEPGPADPDGHRRRRSRRGAVSGVPAPGRDRRVLPRRPPPGQRLPDGGSAPRPARPRHDGTRSLRPAGRAAAPADRDRRGARRRGRQPGAGDGRAPRGLRRGRVPPVDRGDRRRGRAGPRRRPEDGARVDRGGPRGRRHRRPDSPRAVVAGQDCS